MQWQRLGFYRFLGGSKYLAAAIVVQLGLVVLRTVNLYVTGFLTSDEANYALRSMLGLPYGNRLFFDYIVLLVFKVLGINSVSGFFPLFPFYLAFWSILFLFVAYKTLLLLTSRNTAGIVVFSLLFAVAYSLLSVGFLTETPALVLAVVGVYFVVRYVKVARKWQYSIYSLLAFVAAAYTREPYMIFVIGGAFLWALFLLFKHLHGRRAIPSVILIGLALAAPYFLLVPFVTGSAPLILPPPQSPSSTVISTLRMFSEGLFLGWNPVLFFIAIFGFSLLTRNTVRGKAHPFILFLILLSLGCFFFVALQYSSQSAFYTTQGVSTLLRFSNPAIIAYLLLAPQVFERLQSRGHKIVLGTLVVLTILTFGVYTNVTQSNLGLAYNPLTLNNVEGPLQVRNYFLSNPVQSTTFVYTAWDWKAGQLYLLNLPNIVEYPTLLKLYVSEHQFLSDRPTVFYIMGAGPLQSNVTSSLLILNLPDTPPFIHDVFDTLFGVPVDYHGVPYRITSVQVIFTLSTGTLLKVTASWVKP